MATTIAERLHFWCHRWQMVCAAAASGSAILLLIVIFTVRSPLLRVAIPSAALDHLFVPLTLVANAENTGAVCLDGSPPGYHLDRGFGSGADKWVVHLEGGGWCRSLESCSSRKETMLGSSQYMERQVPFYGILSRLPSSNPDFFNWNRVKVRYCDGASFSGDVKHEIQNHTGLFFRGRRIWEALMNELLAKGLESAKQALLTGCSAGGLATFIHCDNLRALLPEETTVKCLPDGGFFLDIKDISGQDTMQSFYKDVVLLQELSNGLQKECILKKEPFHCFFPKEIIKNINTPLFVINSAYDWWQIQNVMVPDTSDPQQNWLSCKMDIHKCDSRQISSLQGFRSSMLDALNDFKHKENGGMFIDSCFLHCQTQNNITWHSPAAPRINNKTVAEAVGDWYFDRKAVKEIDCEYPCNPTCFHSSKY